MILGLKEAKDRQEFLKSRSAVYLADKLKDTPMLILHGKKDQRVLPSHAMAIDKALKEAGGKNHILKIFPDVGHGVLMAKKNSKYFVHDLVVEWCDENILRTKAKSDSVLAASLYEPLEWNWQNRFLVGAKRSGDRYR